MRRLPRASLMLLCALIIGVGLPASQADAGPYSRLQVLLPGEAEAPGTPAGKVGTPIDQTAGIPFTVRVRACDSEWFTVTSITHQIAIESSDETATLPGNQALVNGEMSFDITMNAAGSFTVSADDLTDLTIPQAVSSSVRVLTLAGFEFARVNQKNQYAGQPMPISVWAVDANGVTVSGYSGPVQLRQLTSFGVGRISPQEITLTNGTWSGDVTNFRADETSINRGNVNIEAYLATNPAINGISDPFVVHPGPFARVQLVVPGQTPWPGSLSGISGTPATQAAGQAFMVEVYATDTYWNPLPSTDTVRITSSDTGASTPVGGGLVNGFADFSISLATVGTQTLTVTDQTNGAIQGMTSDGIQVISSAANHFEFDPIASPVVAGEATLVTVRAADIGGNTIPDYNGTALLTAVTGPGTISPELITFSSGVWMGPVTMRGAGGAVTLSCADFSSPPHTGTSASFEVLPGPFTGLQVLVPGQDPAGGTEAGWAGAIDDQNAGTGFSITVRAVDQYWNRVPGVTDRVGLSSSDPFASMPAETTLVNGEIVVPVTAYASGQQTFTAADLDSTEIAGHTSSLVDVFPGPYTNIVLIAPGEQVAPGSEEGRVGAATDQSINYAFTVEVYATDAWWNPVGGATDVISISSGDGNAELPPDTPMVDGHAAMSMRLSTGGFQQVTATNVTQPTMPPSTTQVRAISSGFHLEAEVHPTLVQAGELFSLTVRVTNDAGSVIQEINSSVQVEVQNAVTQEPGSGTLSVATFQLLQGERTVEETYTFAEPIVLVVSDDAGNAPATSEVIVVEPGPPAAVELSVDPTWVRGNKHATVSAAVVDQFQNGVPGQPVAFELVSGPGTLTPIDSETTSTGAATADFLSPRQPAITRVRATSGAFSDELDIETALVDPGLAAGSVNSYPNPFHPGEIPITIAYKLSDAANVSLKIYTLTGGLVLSEDFAAWTQGGNPGLNEFVWDGHNGNDDLVASGVYIVYINAEGAGETSESMRHRIAVVH